MYAETSKGKVLRYRITLEPGMKMLGVQCPQKLVKSKAMISAETRQLLIQDGSAVTAAAKSSEQPQKRSAAAPIPSLTEKQRGEANKRCLPVETKMMPPAKKQMRTIAPKQNCAIPEVMVNLFKETEKPTSSLDRKSTHASKYSERTTKQAQCDKKLDLFPVGPRKLPPLMPSPFDVGSSSQQSEEKVSHRTKRHCLDLLAWQLFGETPTTVNVFEKSGVTKMPPKIASSSSISKALEKGAIIPTSSTAKPPTTEASQKKVTNQDKMLQLFGETPTKMNVLEKSGITKVPPKMASSSSTSKALEKDGIPPKSSTAKPLNKETSQKKVTTQEKMLQLFGISPQKPSKPFPNKK